MLLIMKLEARLLPVNPVGELMIASPESVPLVFKPEEIEYCSRYKARLYEHFAARLGAKMIALGLFGDPTACWQDVWVSNNQYNSPSLLSDKSFDRRIHVSLSHDNNMALAFCATGERIMRIGTDICPAEPFQSPLNRKTTFSEEEIEAAVRQEHPWERFAMYYAAKESVIKILETLSGWIWKEIEVHEGSDGGFQIGLTGSAKERLEQMRATKIVTSLSYREGIGALAFSVALTR